MNYEQKYKEALEKLRAFHRDYKNISHLVDVKEELESIFPELRESEDEKIRKELIQYLKDYPNLPNGNYCRDDFFSWLEKQGEQNKQHLYDIIIALWNLLDKIDTFSDLQIDDTNPDNPFRKIEDITQERHKFVKSDGYNLFIENFMITNDKDFEKQGEQTLTWSENDENMISLLIKIFEVNHPNEYFKVNPIGTTNMEAISTKEIIDWLKSIKPNHWRPSEEQMEALETAIRCRAMPWEQLGTLYNDLKRLIC
jgi:hypothetical protein